MGPVHPVVVWALYIQWWCGPCTSSGGVGPVHPVVVWALYIQWWCGPCTSSGGVGPVHPVVVWALYIQWWCELCFLFAHVGTVEQIYRFTLYRMVVKTTAIGGPLYQHLAPTTEVPQFCAPGGGAPPGEHHRCMDDHT